MISYRLQVCLSFSALTLWEKILFMPSCVQTGSLYLLNFFQKPSDPPVSSRQQGLLVTLKAKLDMFLTEGRFSALQLWKLFLFFLCSNLDVCLLASLASISCVFLHGSLCCLAEFLLCERRSVLQEEREKRRRREGFGEKYLILTTY